MNSILLEVKEGIARIVFNRPDKRNAFNCEMALSFQHALDTCRDNPLVRVVCITANGPSFSAGQDLAEVTDPNGPEMEKILPEQLNPIITRIKNLPLPVVAGVNGVAAGAGANIALCCDIVVASASSVFIQAFGKIGLIPDSGGTYFLPRLIGWQRAAALMMLAENVTAVEAEKMGMIYKSFPDQSFTEGLEGIIGVLSRMPTKALALTKDALSHSAHSDLEEQLNYEEKLQTIAGKTNDFTEGMQAFMEKRMPLFKGN